MGTWNDPRIVDRKLVTNKVGSNIKTYTFGTFGSTVEDAHKYLSAVFDGSVLDKPEKYQWTIAFLYGFPWGGRTAKGADICSFRPITESWNGNYMMDTLEIEDGFPVPRERGTVCEAENIILGREAELRRKCENLPEYLQRWPDIGELFVEKEDAAM